MATLFVENQQRITTNFMAQFLSEEYFGPTKSARRHKKMLNRQ